MTLETCKNLKTPKDVSLHSASARDLALPSILANHFPGKRERKRSGDRASADAPATSGFDGTWVGFECRNTNGDLLDKLSIRVSGRSVLGPRGAAGEISGEVQSQSSSVKYFQQSTGPYVKRALPVSKLK